MKRLKLIIALLPWLSVASSLCAAQTPRPNILYLMADDHALEAIGAYGSWLKDHVKTPTIDRLAAEGMRFNNVCVNNSICSPSRASILTGQYSHKNGVFNLNGSINPTSPMFSEELKKAGYQTAVFGKWHLRSDPRGFDSCPSFRGNFSRIEILEPAKGFHKGDLREVFGEASFVIQKSGNHAEKAILVLKNEFFEGLDLSVQDAADDL